MNSLFLNNKLHTVTGAAKGGGNRAFAPPPLGLRQTLGRECTHQADQGENGNLQ